MDTIKPQRPRRKVPWILGSLVFVSFLLLILLQTSNLWKTISVETASDTLLLYALSSLNFVALIVFGFIFLRSIFKLARERRTLQLGSKIKTRLLLYFFSVSLMPIIAMAVFSYLFMNRAIERWFTQIPENVIREARRVQQSSLIDRSAKLDESARMLAAVIDNREPNREELIRIADAGRLVHIAILSSDSRVLVFYQRPIVPEQQGEFDSILRSVERRDLSDARLRDGKGFDVAFAKIPGGRELMIVPDPFGEETVSQMVDNSLVEFDRLKAEQVTVRQVGFLTLGVLTFLLIFASSWIAFYIARGLTAPIKALAEGADEIAKGNFGYRVETLAEDELSLLVTAFNQMSVHLEENAAELAQRQRYIETVIATLPSGVISFDGKNRVGTINQAAINILKLEDADFSGVEPSVIVRDESLPMLERLLSRAKRVGHASEQTALKRAYSDGRSESASDLPVALTAAALPDGNGVVLVIEDLSELIAAQRASAWQEVARRMAHEIKNPLTPIQLSAERIAKRFIDPAFAEKAEQLNGDEQSRRIVIEGAETILREVQSLKSMVDEFSRFARLPDVKLEIGDVNEVLRQVASMYVDRHADIRIDSNLAARLPDALLDPEQLKRVFVNLIENSIEAFEESAVDRWITVSTWHDAARDLIVIELSDNGRGIDPADFQKLFQPYFSTKGRGTGLGLAIVNRIVSEHKGKIKVVANQLRGAKFIIELPATA